VLTRPQRTHIGQLLCAASVLAAVSAAIVLVADGYSVRFGPFRLASHSALRDLIVTAVAGAGSVALLGRGRADATAAAKRKRAPVHSSPSSGIGARGRSA